MVYTRCLEVPYGIIEMEFAGDANFPSVWAGGLPAAAANALIDFHRP